MYNGKLKARALVGRSDAVILGIESSCDETAAAVVRGKDILSMSVDSQIPIHRRFGGVVPEVASRNHTLAAVAVVDDALEKAGMTLKDIDAVAVTYGAGLLGALLVGVSTAKAIAYACDLPLIKVNHIQGHICGVFGTHPDLQPPFNAVVASGGHTLIYDVKDTTRYEVLGGTTDDAIGEAFDKVGRLLGLPYPGGPEIDRRAAAGTPSINFFKKERHADKDLKLSFSGLKTAVVNYVHTLVQRGESLPVNDICASFQKCAVELLVLTAEEALKRFDYGKLVLAGGVAANSSLRREFQSLGERMNCKVYYPSLALCTDNAAMIALRAHFALEKGEDIADLDLNADSGLI